MAAGWFATGAIVGAVGVAAGAFGAHGLKSIAPPDLVAIFETGARYHQIHALAILAAAWALDRWPGPWPGVAGWCFVVGIVVFSGSLYLLALTGQRWLGAITPIGGVALILGWIALAVSAWRR